MTRPELPRAQDLPICGTNIAGQPQLNYRGLVNPQIPAVYRQCICFLQICTIVLKDGDANSLNITEFNTAFCHYIFSSVNRD